MSQESSQSYPPTSRTVRDRTSNPPPPYRRNIHHIPPLTRENFNDTSTLLSRGGLSGGDDLRQSPTYLRRQLYMDPCLTRHNIRKVDSSRRRCRLFPSFKDEAVQVDGYTEYG